MQCCEILHNYNTISFVFMLFVWQKSHEEKVVDQVGRKVLMQLLKPILILKEEEKCQIPVCSTLIKEDFAKALNHHYLLGLSLSSSFIKE